MTIANRLIKKYGQRKAITSNALLNTNGAIVACNGSAHDVVVQSVGATLSQYLKTDGARVKIHHGELAVEAPAGLSDAQRVEVRRVIRAESFHRVTIVNKKQVTTIEELKRVTVRQVKI